jgi:hypothetical protein
LYNKNQNPGFSRRNGCQAPLVAMKMVKAKGSFLTENKKLKG